MTTRSFLEYLSYFVPMMLSAVVVGQFQESADVWATVFINSVIVLGLFIWWLLGPIEATLYFGLIVGWFVLDFLPSLDHSHHRIVIAVHGFDYWVLGGAKG